jgi:hypothetical protein
MPLNTQTRRTEPLVNAPNSLSLRSLDLEPKARALARFIVRDSWKGDEERFLGWCCKSTRDGENGKGNEKRFARNVLDYLDRYAATLEVDGFAMPTRPVGGPEIDFDADAWCLLHRSEMSGQHDPVREQVAKEINSCFNASIKAIDDEEAVFESVSKRLGELADDPLYADYDAFATVVRDIVWQEVKSRFVVDPAE